METDGTAARALQGKAKTVYATDDPALLVMHYRDDVSAFDGVKLAKLAQKGETNNKINAYRDGPLAAAGIPDALRPLLNERESLVKAMKMIPVECVVRNVCAGLDGQALRHRRGLGSPSPSSSSFSRATRCTIRCATRITFASGMGDRRRHPQMKKLTHDVNAVLKPLFADAGIDLVDYKLEFGHPLDDPAGRCAGRRVHAGRLPAVGREDRREARQGPFPPRSRQRDRALPRSGAAHRRAVVRDDELGAALRAHRTRQARARRSR
jgi:phosphoribosylaminoimidazole-succinocarboxamide synthase